MNNIERIAILIHAWALVVSDMMRQHNAIKACNAIIMEEE